MLNGLMEEMELVHKCMDTTQKAILALKLYTSGLSEETKVLREQGMQDRAMIVNLSRRMQEMEIRMKLLQAQNTTRAPLVDLTISEVPEVLGSPIRMSLPPGLGWSQRASVMPQLGESSLRVVEEMAQEWVRSEDGSPDLS